MSWFPAAVEVPEVRVHGGPQWVEVKSFLLVGAGAFFSSSDWLLFRGHVPCAPVFFSARFYRLFCLPWICGALFFFIAVSLWRSAFFFFCFAPPRVCGDDGMEF